MRQTWYVVSTSSSSSSSSSGSSSAAVVAVVVVVVVKVVVLGVLVGVVMIVVLILAVVAVVAGIGRELIQMVGVTQLCVRMCTIEHGATLAGIFTRHGSKASASCLRDVH